MITGTLVLPDGSLPTASFPVGPDAEFTATDYSDQNNVVRYPPALIFGDLALTAMPEPRAPLAAFGAALLMTLWRRRRSQQRRGDREALWNWRGRPSHVDRAIGGLGGRAFQLYGKRPVG
jgi:hypothetical protein